MNRQPDGAIAASVAVGPLLAPVLSRLLGALAARAEMPVDRLGDVLLLADTLAAAAPGTTRNGRFGLEARVAPRTLELHVGPLGQGGAARIRSAATLPGAGDVLAGLCSRIETITDPAGDETLFLLVDA